jgi:hypothetical protein
LPSLPPPHKKFLCKHTNSFITQDEALKKEKKYSGKLERTELMRVTLAPIDKRRPFQEHNLFFIDSKMGDQVILLLGLAPTGMPRKRKGIDSTPQCKNDEDALINRSSRFIP